MASALQNAVSQFGNVSQQPATRQLGLLFGLAASIALGIGLVQWASEPDFMPLYGEMSPGATTEVLQSLDANGIEYRYDGRSGMVAVASDKVHQARLQLASEGLPEGDKSGFSMLYEEQQMGVSSFIEKARYDRALEHELARSIASLDSVKAARVHLAMPKQSAFVRKSSKPAASVLLSLYPGRDLTDRQLAGVAFLVGSSVPGLTADNVSVVDNQGKLLSAQNDKEGLGYTKEQFRYTQQLEESYIDRINEILTPILGVGAFRAQVTADVDFTRIERTSESYAPEQKIRSEQLTEDLTENTMAQGIPGTLTNQPPRETQIGADVPPDTAIVGKPSLPIRSSKKEVRNYELDKTISHIREASGNLNKLSVAVVVDYRTTIGDSGEPERLSLTDQQMAEVNSLVREAVGFSETRGDSVNVVSAGFVDVPVLEAIPEPSLLEQDWIWKVAKITLAAIGFLLLVFTVLRPLMQAGSLPAGKTAQLGGPTSQPGMLPAGESVTGMALGEDQVTLGQQQQQLGLPGGAPAYQQQLTMARNMVDQEPERVAHVVKNWVAADG